MSWFIMVKKYCHLLMTCCLLLFFMGNAQADGNISATVHLDPDEGGAVILGNTRTSASDSDLDVLRGVLAEGTRIPAAVRLEPKNNALVAGKLENIVIDKLDVLAASTTGSLQGVVGTDGCFVNIRITNSIIRTGSPNKIRLNGLASGYINNVKDSKGNLIVPRLEPLRIGGEGDGTQKVYVLSLDDKKHLCSPKTLTGNNAAIADDLRKKLPDYEQNVVGLCDFRLESFKADITNMTLKQAMAMPDVNKTIGSWGNHSPELLLTDLPDLLLQSRIYQELAKQYGKLCATAQY